MTEKVTFGDREQDLHVIEFLGATAARSALPRPLILSRRRPARVCYIAAYLSAMNSIDFDAAQQRVEERRQQIAARTRTIRQSQRSVRASRASGRLPFPLQGFAQRGIDVWDTIKGSDGTGPAFRVGQVDAELLDEELLELLRGQVGEGLKYFGVQNHSPFEVGHLS